MNIKASTVIVGVILGSDILLIEFLTDEVEIIFEREMNSKVLGLEEKNDVTPG